MTIFNFLIVIFLPGLVLALFLTKKSASEIAIISFAGALGILWTTIISFMAVLAGVPLSTLILSFPGILLLAVFLAIPRLRKIIKSSIANIQWRFSNIIIYLLIVLFLSLPFFTVHKLLPTGDIQKSIYWAENIVETNKFPNYELSKKLNRDPSDFLTPGLHTLTASIIKLSGDRLYGTALFAFLASVILAGLAPLLARLYSQDNKIQVLSFVLASLNIRFLRYPFSPGYHFQNLIGEILLFLGLYFFLNSLFASNKQKSNFLINFLGGLVCLGVIPLVHQFTAFMAIILFGIFFAAAILLRIKKIALAGKRKPVLYAITVISGIIFAVLALYLSPFSEKAGALFNLNPHLKPFTVNLLEYPDFYGPALFLPGLAGILLYLYYSIKKRNAALLSFAFFCLTILILGQGSNLFIDIPSARALFYGAVPLSVMAALFFDKTFFSTAPKRSPVVNVIFITLFAAALANSASGQLSIANHHSRVNASLTEDTVSLLNFFDSRYKAKQDVNLLIDDWNRRRLTWMILSPFNMLTRIGGDLRTIGDESGQSVLRKEIYENNLDYEKIFMLGNSPLIGSLMEKHRIAFVAAANDVTASNFKNNPLLSEVYSDADTTLFAFRSDTKIKDEKEEKESAFLLNRATLANDIGDDEDIHSYSPISLVATRLKSGAETNGINFREIESADSIIRFNAGSYVQNLWDKNRDSTVELPVRILLRVLNNGVEGSLFHDNKEITSFSTPKDGRFQDLIVDVNRDVLTINKKGFIDIEIRVKHGPFVLDLVAAGINGQNE